VAAPADPIEEAAMERATGMLGEFKEFLLRGNVVELAVAVVIGAAFGAVITSLVDNLLTPLIAAIFGEPDFAELSFTINGSEFTYGLFINALISFVLIAAAVFFVVVKPYNAMQERRRRREEENPTTRACPECANDIPIAAHRCGFCTSQLA
jgi:large conductance mechanosensitive channel